MKKLFFLLIPLLTVVSVQSQDSTKLTAQQVYRDVKSGFKDAVEGLKDLATKLEGPAKHVYGVYVNQYRMEGIATGSLIIALFTLSTIFLKFSLKRADFDGGNVYCFFVVMGLLAVVVAIIILFSFFLDSGGLTKLLNPEYHAIQDIIKTFK